MTIALTAATGPTRRVFLGVERSVCGRAWRDRLDERGAARALAITQRHDDVPELLARILAGRGIEVDAVASFLDPTVRALMPDPDSLADMRTAAVRLADGIMRGETIAILGDYDVDGATSAAVLGRYLLHCGVRPIIHIPDRLFEGYGPNAEAIRSLAARGATLLVAVDCGTTSHEPMLEARKLGLDVVVIDHHQADELLPAALAVVNPNDVEAELARLEDRFMARGAAIDGDQERRAARGERADRLPHRAVAFEQAVRNMDDRTNAAGSGADPPQHRRRRRSVDIVVAQDGDGFRA